ncbi:MAG: lysophospholipid acyltransferase family protein [Vicinamibacterales bacterium]
MKLPPFHWWRTVFYLIPAVTLYTVGCGVMSLLSTFWDPQGYVAHGWARRWARLILVTTGVTVKRVGAPLPAANESCIYVVNHSSHYDTPVLFTALPAQLRTMAKAGLGRVPFIGWHLARAGHLLVDRKNPGAGIFKRMQRMTTQGASLFVFPEGSRTTDGSVGRFKAGIFLLAIETGLPVVPISVVNTRAVMPKGRLMTCPAHVTVVVHERLLTSGLTREDARSLARRAQAIVAAGVRTGAAQTGDAHAQMPAEPAAKSS